MVSAVFFCHVIMSLHGLQPTVPYFDISCWTRSANYTIFHLKILMRVDIKDENSLICLRSTRQQVQITLCPSLKIMMSTNTKA